MIRDLFVAAVTFVAAALFITVVATVAGNALYPTAESILEARLQSPDSPASEPETQETDPEVIAERQIAESVILKGDPEADSPPAPAPETADEATPPPEVDAGPAQSETSADAGSAQGERTGETETAPEPESEPPRPATEDAESETAGDPEPSRALTRAELDEILTPGEIRPLIDGRIAYKVQPGDTFSQICKKVVGSGSPPVWRAAAEDMNVDLRTLSPGQLLIFGPPETYLPEGFTPEE